MTQLFRRLITDTGARKPPGQGPHGLCDTWQAQEPGLWFTATKVHFFQEKGGQLLSVEHP